MRSKIVVLPAPFGPIKPRISPSRSVKLASSTARMPPKVLVMARTSSTTGFSASSAARALAATVVGAAAFSLPFVFAAPSRNTERTMSSRSSSSAVEPSKRTSPFSMK